MRIGRCLLFILLALACFAGARASSIPAVQVSEPPTLDGTLSDACWKAAPSVSDFYFCSDGTKAPEPTTTWLCYDQTNIYMAFRCIDSQPDKIVAQQTKRGGSISNDDWVGFDLDCFGIYRQVIWFDVSAGGVQLENLQSGDASKIEWRGDWSASAKRLDNGYAVEIAIPFSILQYDPNRTSMGIGFIRRHARTGQWWWAPDVGPNYDARKFHTWDGLKLPRPTGRTVVLGYSLLGGGDGERTQQSGLDVKHMITPSMTGLLTVNPDFHNVEQGAESVDFSYSERWRSDSRPFFQEGAAYFPGSTIFYTRRIENIDTGLKVSGKMGAYGLGLARVDRFDKENHTILQFGGRWRNESQLQCSGVFSEAPGVHRYAGTAYFERPVFRRGTSSIWMDAQYSGADTATGGYGQFYSTGVWTEGRPKTIQWSVGYSVMEAEFDPYLGLVGEKDRKSWGLSFWISDEPSKGRIRDWSANLYMSTNKRPNGSLHSNEIGVSSGMGLAEGTSMSLGLSQSHRPPFFDRVMRSGIRWRTKDLYRSGGVDYGFGRRGGGDYSYWYAAQKAKIADKLLLNASYEWARISDPSPDAFLAFQYVIGLSWDLDTERTLGGRAIIRDNRTNLYLAFKQRVRAGVDAYAIYGDPNAETTKNAFAVKLISPM